MSVPCALRPAIVSGLRTSAAWNMTMPSGVSMGALVRMGRSAGPSRMNDRTGDPFFSDPYDEKCDALNDMRSTAAVARICPAACAPRPPIDSNRSSKNRSASGQTTSGFSFRGDDAEYQHYAASKAGVVALTRTIARHHGREGVTAFAVAPGFVRTSLNDTAFRELGEEAICRDIPLGEMAEPEDIANLVAFLASGLARHATGTTVDINGASYVR